MDTAPAAASAWPTWALVASSRICEVQRATHMSVGVGTLAVGRASWYKQSSGAKRARTPANSYVHRMRLAAQTWEPMTQPGGCCARVRRQQSPHPYLRAEGPWAKDLECGISLDRVTERRAGPVHLQGADVVGCQGGILQRLVNQRLLPWAVGCRQGRRTAILIDPCCGDVGRRKGPGMPEGGRGA